MDAKLFTDRSLNLSGLLLFLLLAAGLSGAAFWFDWTTGQRLLMTLPFWLCALVTTGLGFWAVPILRAWKFGQIVREEGPQSHLKKTGTPTMGGIFFVPAALALAVLWSGFAADVVAVSALTLAYMLIGWLDDWQIIRRRSNKGLSPKLKLFLQMACASLFCLWLFLTHPHLTAIGLPFGWALPLGILFWPLAGFVLVAESNATNLTDGMDGLAAGTVAIALLALGGLIIPTDPGLALFCACLSGGCLGFLAHNRHPAKVFMGDTGSLALGGALAAVALLSNTLFPLLILGGLFLVETLSVMAQVYYYKATKGPDGIGKRLFKMSPFHNHLELSGWSESQVVAWFYSIGAILAGLTVWLYRLP